MSDLKKMATLPRGTVIGFNENVANVKEILNRVYGIEPNTVVGEALGTMIWMSKATDFDRVITSDDVVKAADILIGSLNGVKNTTKAINVESS